ncbi:MAG: hypothetical protein ACI915_003916 [Gammaproteobacteria bacterium]|jgi:hypothetical protein
MKLEIRSVESAFDELSFGEFGPYEKVVGRAHGEVDPSHRLNLDVINLDKAPRNAAGLVEYSVDFCVLKPVDMSKANRRLLYDAPNRGDKLALVDLNESVKGVGSNELSSAEDAGNGFLMRQGYVIVFSAWDGGVTPGVGYVEDAQGHMIADFPVATNEGAPIVATIREEIIFAHAKSPARSPLAYPAHEPDTGNAALTVRQHEQDTRVLVSNDRWRFVSNREIEVDLVDGFDAGALYELIYAACDPVIMGLGFVGVRDLLEFLRYADVDSAGTLNPLNLDGSPGVDYAIAHGRSQPGRFLREFLRLGFNEDFSGRPVFDGVYTTLTGSRRMFLNEPFSQPGRFPRQHEDHLFPGDQFPFTYPTITDPVSGKTGGILARCMASNTCPKIMHVDSSTEFWQGRSSLVVTDQEGSEIELPDEVRAYLLTGTGHAGPQMLAHAAMYWSPSLNPVNEQNYCALVRALITALDAWVTEGTAPPPNCYPSVADGTLVPPQDLDFPEIPGATYTGRINGLCDRDYATQPPSAIAGRDYAVLVPTVDSDGNEISGIRSPDVGAPLGTYTGWNLRGANYAEGALMIVGSFLPFATTAAERKKTGDPRPSLAERYPTHVDYVEAVRTAASELYDQRFLLNEDVERYVASAKAASVGK